MDSFKTLNFDESDVFLPTNIEAIDSILGKLDLFPHINSTGMYPQLRSATTSVVAPKF